MVVKTLCKCSEHFSMHPYNLLITGKNWHTSLSYITFYQNSILSFRDIFSHCNYIFTSIKVRKNRPPVFTHLFSIKRH